MFERLGIDHLRSGVTEQHFAEGRQPRRFPIPTGIEHVAQGPRHLLETALVESRIQDPAAVHRLVRQVVSIEDDLGLEPTGGPDDAPVGHLFALVVIRRQLNRRPRPESTRLSGIGRDFHRRATSKGEGRPNHAHGRPSQPFRLSRGDGLTVQDGGIARFFGPVLEDQRLGQGRQFREAVAVRHPDYWRLRRI